ncbi:MAG: DUF222 domain-containing protein [Microbacterium sp.]
MDLLTEPAPVDGEPPIPDAVDLVVEVDAMVSVFAAQRYRRIEALRREMLDDAWGQGSRMTDVMERSVRLELASALRVTEAAAGRLIADAEALVHRYPAVLDSLSEARITPRHATDVVELLDPVEPEVREALIPVAVALAESLPVGTFRRKLRARVDAARVVSLPVRYDEAVRARRVVIEVAEDGMSWLHAFVPTVEAHAIHDRLTRMGKAMAGRRAGDPDADPRSLDQVRADIVCDLLIDGGRDLPAVARGIGASVVVTVPALSLLDADGEGDSYATVEGLGPIPIERARVLCGGADGWMRVLTHPETGMVLSVGRERYSPPPALAKLVKWRAERCMAPGCGVPASRCQIDHNLAWEHGGHTALANHAPLCQGHHTVKHHGRWCVEQIEGSGGSIRWTSPTGRTYVVDPERRVPVFGP